MTETTPVIEVPNLPATPSHVPAGWLELIKQAIELLDREDPEWRLIQIKQKLGGLRIYYEPSSGDEPHPKTIEEALKQIEDQSLHVCDVCGASGSLRGSHYARRTRCERHEQADDVDATIVVRPVLQLNDQMDGAWLVTTRGSRHIWNLDDMTYTRLPGRSSGSGAMAFDGNPMPITRVEAWPEVGNSFFVWFDDPDAPVQIEHYRISSRISRIEQLPAAEETTHG